MSQLSNHRAKVHDEHYRRDTIEVRCVEQAHALTCPFDDAADMLRLKRSKADVKDLIQDCEVKTRPKRVLSLPKLTRALAPKARDGVVNIAGLVEDDEIKTRPK